MSDDSDTTQRMLLLEARHNENLASFREVRAELRGIKLRLDDIEEGRDQVKRDMAATRADVAQMLDLLRSGRLIRNGFAWCVGIGTSLVIAYAAWVHK